jgi:hypothetical protein
LALRCHRRLLGWPLHSCLLSAHDLGSGCYWNVLGFDAGDIVPSGEHVLANDFDGAASVEHLPFVGTAAWWPYGSP